MRKRFDNKTHYDPGRFRFTLEFKEQATEPDGYGGTTNSGNIVLTTQAVQEPLKEGSQLAIQAGASVLNQDCYFVIRNRADFYPNKLMNVICDSVSYVIKAIIPIDVPVNYVKILCVKAA